MPNILPSEKCLSLDELRDNPGRLISLRDLAGMGVFHSYDAAQRAVRQGRLSTPYRIGLRPLWEARAILKMLGAPLTTPTDENEQPVAA